MVYRSQTLRCVLTTVDICPTSTIDEAAVEMVQLAKHLGSLVLAEFNGIELHARPNTFPEHVATSYHEAMLKRERIVKSHQHESTERTIPISQMEIHEMQFTDLELERQRHANEVHELNRVNEELLQQVEFFEIKLRDQFAMAAIAGIIPTDAEEMLYERRRQTAAELAYQVADAMIAERERGLSVKPS